MTAVPCAMDLLNCGTSFLQGFTAMRMNVGFRGHKLKGGSTSLLEFGIVSGSKTGSTFGSSNVTVSCQRSPVALSVYGVHGARC